MHGKEVLIMADLRAEAMRLIQQMPDRELALIMSTLREKANPVDEEEAQRKRDEGWKTFQKYIGRLPADFDYKKELEEAREERFRKYANLG